MRVKSEIWAKAYIRRCQTEGLYAMVLKSGDHDAGAIYIKVNTLDGKAQLYSPAPAGFEEGDFDRMWMVHSEKGPVDENEIDSYINNQLKSDPDIWVIELEDKQGRSFIDEAIFQF